MSFLCFGCVGQGSVRVVERLGRFARIASPGFSCLAWPLEYFAGDAPTSLRVQQLDVRVESKTADDVFVTVQVSVQYVVDPDKVYDAFYSTTNPHAQITAWVFDSVRATCPTLTLDAVFLRKDVIASAVKNELEKAMSGFGFKILQALIPDITPEASVRAAMNEIQAQQRLRQAAREKAEANKILSVTAAEAEAEAKYLQGQGIARQRQAIVAGLRESVKEFGAQVEGVNSRDVLSLMLMTQWLDTMQSIGSTSRTNAIFMPHSPAAFGDLSQQISSAVLATTAPAAEAMAR